MKRTFQARVPIIDEQALLLDGFAALSGKVERTLFAETTSQNKKTDAVKNAYLKRFNITSRQFNAIKISLAGKVTAIRALRKNHIAATKQKIKKAESVIKKLKSQFGVKLRKNARRTPQDTLFSLHHKQRRLAFLNCKLDKLQADQKSGKVNLCFGSKKLFNAQHYLEKNDFANHDEWLAQWRSSRDDSFSVIGSKDESAGNQSCVMTLGEHGNATLRLRLPNNSAEKYLILPITLNYGLSAIEKVLANKKAIFYRFKRDHKGWRVFITVEAPIVEQISNINLGTIGVDINAEHLAVAETDRFGNLVGSTSIKLNTYGKSAHQTKAIIGDAIKELMTFSAGKNKPIVIEKLDFSKKKSALESDSKDKHQKRYARMLSSLSYNKIKDIILSRAFDAGLEVIEVNPAYTSIVGFWKFATRYGLSSHQAAALTIARRAQNFSEQPNHRDYNATQLPVRKAGVHIWSYWRSVARKPRKLVVLHTLRKQSLCQVSPVI